MKQYQTDATTFGCATVRYRPMATLYAYTNGARQCDVAISYSRSDRIQNTAATSRRTSSDERNSAHQYG